MNRIDQLIQQMCPDGVAFSSLGSVCLRPTNIKWNLHADETFSYIDLTSVDRETNSINNTQMISSENAPSRAQQIVQSDDVLFGTTRPTLQRYCSIPDQYDGQICSTGFCVLRADPLNVLPRWIFHQVSSAAFQAYVEDNEHGASYPAISDADVKRFRMPVPPLEVQRAIVEILDYFTELEVELEAELEARRKQYAFYQNHLINKPGCDELPLMSLVDIGDWSGGGTPSKGNAAFWRNGTIPWVTSKDMGPFELEGTEDHITELAIASCPVKLLHENSIAIEMRSGILKHTLPISLIPFEATVNQDIRVVTVRADIFPRYVLHTLRGLSNRILTTCRKVGGTVESIDTKKLMAYRIPMPSLENQRETAEILDSFTGLEATLEGELTARRKQYEYYRDKLLTFKEAA